MPKANPVQALGGAGTEAATASLREARLAGDPFAVASHLADSRGDPGERSLSAAWLASVGAAQADGMRPLELWVADHPNAPADMRSFAYQTLAQLYHLHARYDRSARAYEAAVEADPTGIQPEIHDSLRLAQLAARVGPMRRSGAPGCELEASVDFANLIRLPVQLGPEKCALVFDTGAEISVLAASVATRAGARFLDGAVVVGSTTDNVNGRLAVIDRLGIGGMIFENVLFLVLEDENTTFADGKYFLDGIIGLQVFRSAGRVAWLERGKRLAFGTNVPPVTAGGLPLFWHESGVGLGLPFNGGLAPGFFDSGAAGTRFTSRALESLPEGERRPEMEPQKRAGMGGEQTIMVQRIPRIDLRLGDAKLSFRQAIISPAESFAQGKQDIAVVGLSSVRRLDRLVVDFESMRYLASGAANEAL